MINSRREFLGLLPVTLIGGPLVLSSLFEESDPALDPDYLAELERLDALPVSAIPDDKCALVLNEYSATGARLTIPKGVVVDGFKVQFGEGAPEWGSAGWDAYIKHVDTHPAEIILRRDLWHPSQQPWERDVFRAAMHQRSNFVWQSHLGREVVFQDAGGECILEGEIKHGSHLTLKGWWL